MWVHVSLRDGGPAFPRPHSWDESAASGMHEGDRAEPHGAQSGMTLRDYFAASVMPVVAVALTQAPRLPDDVAAAQFAAAMAYTLADAMLAERAK